MGNLAVAMHLVLAIMVIVGGALQLVPRVRQRTRAPASSPLTAAGPFACSSS